MITARPDSLKDRGQRSERSGHNEIDYNSLKYRLGLLYGISAVGP